ncbi:hypothetical_protein [Leishmania braziliensis MHOM/BR/75/M2904]|uniref:Hypothetical_protein n=1 Tax=Leishmania braziliensis MHOM/BR/75/M2904 TaxID=420245 RepID=A0A3P3Z417_LEIBR|nr:hypothetical_protein [Leishmania braziliensis MHOM/BR/75/M2904]
MNSQDVKKSPWRDILEEVIVEPNLIESFLHVAPESRENRRDPPVDFSAPSLNGCDSSKLRRRGTARSAGPRTLISPSPERQNSSALRGNSSPLAKVDQSRSANKVGANTESYWPSMARETSKAVEALVEALSTSSWSSSSSGSVTQLGLDFTSTRDTASSSAKVYSSSESPRSTVASDIAQSHRETADTGQFFLKATHVVASEFEGRQSIVFAEFTEATELVSQFVCRVTMTSFPL